MKAYVACGSILILAFNFLLAGGAALPRREDMPKYIKTLKSSSAKPGEKVQAAEMIGRRGEVSSKDVAEAIAPLKAVAKDDRDAATRKAAIQALGRIAPDDKDTVPLLVQILRKEKTPDLKMTTMQALARFGPRAKEALPAIREYGQTLDKKEKRNLQGITNQIQGILK